MILRNHQNSTQKVRKTKSDSGVVLSQKRQTLTLFSHNLVKNRLGKQILLHNKTPLR